MAMTLGSTVAVMTGGHTANAPPPRKVSMQPLSLPLLLPLLLMPSLLAAARFLWRPQLETTTARAP
jgi:hypothetical protein